VHRAAPCRSVPVTSTLDRMEEVATEVRLLRGPDVIHGRFRAWEPQPDDYQVEVVFEGRRIGGSGEDYFEALLVARRNLESEGLLICLAGAQRDVWPSPMARSMGPALNAYRMTLGQQARTEDLVYIFAESETPASVREQEGYRDAWFESLGSSGPSGAAI